MLRIHATRPHPYPAEALYFLIPHIVASAGNTPADYRFEANGRLPSGETFAFAVTPLVEEIGEATNDAIIAALATHATLAPTVSKAEILANGLDETRVTLPSGENFTYQIYRNNLLAFEGTVSDGVLDIATDTADTYTVEVKVGQNTGYVEFEAKHEQG